jgi:hypothetical protein
MGGWSRRHAGGVRGVRGTGEWVAVQFVELGSYRLSDERQPLVELQVTVE